MIFDENMNSDTFQFIVMIFEANDFKIMRVQSVIRPNIFFVLQLVGKAIHFTLLLP